MGKNLCFTGHRPEKLMPYFDENSAYIQSIKEYLRQEIETAIAEGYDSFYSGVARGIDLFASEIVLEYRRTKKQIKHIAVIPFAGQEEQWSADWQERYHAVISQSDIQMVLRNQYAPDCFRNRNAFMVENCQRVIAVYLGGKNGTSQTLAMAAQQGKEIHQYPIERAYLAGLF